jgi:Na+-transporting NADH:ubiquinone oxidoreductase subunit NqrB
MDREQAEVYKIIGDIIAKLALVGATILVLFVMTAFLLWKPNVYFAAVDSVFAGTVFMVIRHYFPANRSTKDKKKPPKKP